MIRPFALLIAVLLIGLPCGAQESTETKTAPAQPISLNKSSLPGTHPVHTAGDVMLAGQPSKEALEQLSKSGFKTIVSLRREGEERYDEASLCEQLGMKFIRLPIGAPDDMDEKLVRTACAILRSANPDAKVLLHCASANRVGAVWLTHRVQEHGLAIEAARQEASAVGLQTKELESRAIELIDAKP